MPVPSVVDLSFDRKEFALRDAAVGLVELKNYLPTAVNGETKGIKVGPTTINVTLDIQSVKVHTRHDYLHTTSRNEYKSTVFLDTESNGVKAVGVAHSRLRATKNLPTDEELASALKNMWDQLDVISVLTRVEPGLTMDQFPSLSNELSDLKESMGNQFKTRIYNLSAELLELIGAWVGKKKCEGFKDFLIIDVFAGYNSMVNYSHGGRAT